MENKKSNNKLVIFLLIIIILLLVGGGFLFYQTLSDKPNSNLGGSENNNQHLSGEENNNKLNNYDLDNIKNVVVEVPILNSQDPEMKKVTITNKDEINNLLLNVDNATEVGKMPEGIGFINNVTISVNYNADPSAKIIILGNGNVAINYSLGAGETGYAEYSIENKKLASELTNKYNDSKLSD